MCNDKVTFLFKNKGDCLDENQYRPICIDHPFVKIQCEILNKKVLPEIDRYLGEFNYSYTPKKSTQSAIIQLCHIVTQIRNRGNYALVICTDCSGAFETIQSRLIGALLRTSIKDGKMKPIQWTLDYLHRKKLYTTKGTTQIPIKRIIYEVGSGQGSKTSPKFWLFQSSSATFHLEACKNSFLVEIEGIGLFQIIFADDNVAVIEIVLLSDGINMGPELLQKIRTMVAEFLKVWEKILSRCGMILNQTKTEVLTVVQDDSTYPKLKSCIKWLGIHLTMDDKGYVVPHLEENLKMVRSKSLRQFEELTLLSTKIVVRKKIFDIYIQSLIDYCLIVFLAARGNFQNAINKFQVLQNSFLRKVGMVGNMAKIEELHYYLDVKTIEEKVKRLAYNEWGRTTFKNSFKPEPPNHYNLRNSQTTNKFHLIDLESRLYYLSAEYHNELLLRKPRHKFNLIEFDKWANPIRRKTNELVEQQNAKTRHIKFMKEVEAQLNIQN